MKKPGKKTKLKRKPRKAKRKQVSKTKTLEDTFKSASKINESKQPVFRTLIDILVLGIVVWFLLSYFNPQLLLLDTSTAGGDTCAHNYLASYMKDYLLPNGKVFGWSPGWWAGFPIFQYYFFMPYLLMALLSYIIPLTVSFKLISVLGVFALPFATYFSLKYMKYRFPIPILASILSLLFLFHEQQKVWGMNIASTLAGEISVSISFAAMVLFIGLIYRDTRDGKFRLRNAVLFAFIVLTHLTTALVAGLASIFLVIVLDKEKFRRNIIILAKTYGLAFLFTAFWSISLVSKLGYSVGFGEEWNINAASLYPTEAWVAMAFGAYAIIRAFMKKNTKTLYLLFTVLASIFFFYTAFDLNLVNIRFWPFHYYYIFVLGAIGVLYLVEDVLKLIKLEWIREYIEMIIVLLAAAIVVVYLNGAITYTESWIVGNYEGYESKMAWTNFKGIMNTIQDTPGRVANDLTEMNVPFCSSRSFEATPYFSGKPVIEGGIVQSSISSLFTYYIQCESSTHCAGYPRIMTPTRFNFDDATEHMKYYNVKHFIAAEKQVKEAISKHSEWSLLATYGRHEVYELLTNDGSYVYVPAYNPVLVEDSEWEYLSMRWFSDVTNLETPIALTSKIMDSDSEYFSDTIEDSRLVWSTLMNKQPEHIGEWLVCGAFDNPRYVDWTPENSWNSSLDYGLNISYIGEKTLEPVEGEDCAPGKIWVKYYAQGNGFVDLYTIFEPETDNKLAYVATYVYSPGDRKVDLWYGSDDGVKVWLNNKLVEENHIHRGTIGVTDKVEVNLNDGWNLVVIKIENVVSGWGLYAKFLDQKDNDVTDLMSRVSPDVSTQLVNLKSEPIREDCVIDENVSEEEIVFTTDCIGQPHIIKVSYFPNWKVEGASKIYMVTPAFMLVYPEETRVRLYYGSTTADNIGLLLTAVGLLMAVLHLIRQRGNGKK